MSLLAVAGANSASGGYDIDNSLKFESDNSEYLERTQGTPDSRKTGSVSFWIKRTEVSTSSVQFAFEAGNTDNDNGRIFLRFQTDDTLRIAGGSTVFRNTSQIFRDTNAWYHILVVIDTTQSTADDRIKLYVNGSQVTDFGTKNNFSQNDLTGINYQKLSWGRSHVDSSSYSNMYLAEAITLDGVAASPTDFGEFDDDTGIWIPKDPSGLTFGSEGTYLDFSSSSDLGNDASGNNNDFGTLGNIAAADQALDVPTNNFNVFTGRYNYGSSYSARVTEGGTRIAHPHASWSGAKGSFGVINGKWYWEFTTMGNLQNVGFGIQSTNTSTSLYNHHAIQNNNTIFIGYSTLSYYYWTGGSQTSNESTGWASGFTVGAGDVYGFALDLDSSTKKFLLYRNGTVLNGSGTNLPTPMQDEYLSPFIGAYNGDGTRWNFGGYTSATISSGNSDANGYGNFEYSVPSGYYAICSKNLAEYG